MTLCTGYFGCFIKGVGLGYFFAAIYTVKLVEASEFRMLMDCECESF
jgi:hypothetical protein